MSLEVCPSYVGIRAIELASVPGPVEGYFCSPRVLYGYPCSFVTSSWQSSHPLQPCHFLVAIMGTTFHFEVYIQKQTACIRWWYTEDHYPWLDALVSQFSQSVLWSAALLLQWVCWAEHRFRPNHCNDTWWPDTIFLPTWGYLNSPRTMSSLEYHGWAWVLLGLD